MIFSSQNSNEGTRSNYNHLYTLENRINGQTRYICDHLYTLETDRKVELQN